MWLETQIATRGHLFCFLIYAWNKPHMMQMRARGENTIMKSLHSTLVEGKHRGWKAEMKIIKERTTTRDVLDLG